MALNAQYNIAAPNSLAARIAAHQRRRMYERFVAELGITLNDTIIDVGATSDRTYDHSNYLEAWYPHKNRITAVGIDDASFLEQVYPGITFQRADGRALPFDGCTFDYAHSSAVIEHVGSRADQVKLLAELWRVCRKGVFVTTPNRWFPVEFHTVLPL
ncbi:MAG: class I SAM-dependent methyltransferase, partial [Terriglobales bacterium]